LQEFQLCIEAWDSSLHIPEYFDVLAIFFVIPCRKDKLSTHTCTKKTYSCDVRFPKLRLVYAMPLSSTENQLGSISWLRVYQRANLMYGLRGCAFLRRLPLSLQALVRAFFLFFERTVLEVISSSVAASVPEEDDSVGDSKQACEGIGI